MLRRDQLQAFLGSDQRAIREFEAMSEQTDDLAQAGGVASLIGLATSADARAGWAQSELARIKEAIRHAITSPSDRHNSTSTDYIDLPEDGPHVTTTRRIQWNKDDGTLDVGLYNDVVLQCGQETHAYCKNTSGVVIPNGSSVMVTGTVGASGKLTIAKAVANGTIQGDYMLGVATHDIPINAFGYVTIYGLVRGMDATGTPFGEVWADGDILYFSPTTAGYLTKVRPNAPALRSRIAIVVNAAAGGAGAIFVRMKVGETISGLDDVYTPAPWGLSTLMWNPGNNRYENQLVWVDIDFPIIVRTTGPNIPTLTTLQGNITAPQWAVGDFNVCEGQELIHEWKEGSAVYWHLHMITNGTDATARYVNWEIEWFVVNPNGIISSTTVDTSEVLIPANTPSKVMIVANISIPSFAGITIGAHVFARLRRIALTTPGRTGPTLNPWCSMLQLHVQCDSTGSTSRTAK